MGVGTATFSEAISHYDVSNRLDSATMSFSGRLWCADIDTIHGSKLARSLKKTRHVLRAAGGAVLRLFLCTRCLPAASYCAWVYMTSQEDCLEEGPRGRSNKIDPALAFLGQ
ncbi:hypothetical protein LSAT2_033064 [Lamellibrachia satsuma]|nr:hypothetical protein LSAT2_033064 [Lamellibrachia satsuma]